MNEICIIGAGLSGILLGKHFKKSIILEKSRGIGGRLASRRLGGLPLNHGPREIILDNVLISDPHEWIKAKAAELSILNNWEVSHLSKNRDKIIIFGKDGKHLETKKLIFTSPAPQTKSILERSDLKADFLNLVRYSSTIQFMALFPNHINSGLLEASFKLSYQKHISENLTLRLYEAKEESLPQFIEMDKEQIKAFCLSKLDGDVLDSHAHKWRYSQVIDSISSKYQFHFSAENIFLAGDYFGGHGAMDSAESVGRIICHLSEA